MVLAALICQGLFSALGLIPAGPRPTNAAIFGSLALDYKLALNIAAAGLFGALFWLTFRRGATDPVCGMTVDRDKSLKATQDGRTYHFCSEHCLHTFQQRRPASSLAEPPYQLAGRHRARP